MRKYLSLLVLVCVFLFGGCTNFKDIKEFDIEGTELSIKQFEFYVDKYEKFLDENNPEIEDQWYDIDIDIVDQSYKDDDNYTKTMIKARGKMFLSRFTFNNKIKLDIDVMSITKEKDDDEVEEEKLEQEIEYVQINGSTYCKVEEESKADGMKKESESYYDEPTKYVKTVLEYLLTDVVSEVFTMSKSKLDYYDYKLYKIKNGYAIDLNRNMSKYGNKYLVSFTTQKDTYQVKKAEAYVKTFETVGEYINTFKCNSKMKTVWFAFVNEPNNVEDYKGLNFDI